MTGQIEFVQTLQNAYKPPCKLQKHANVSSN